MIAKITEWIQEKVLVAVSGRKRVSFPLHVQEK